jgi:pilus assembly protein FimV
MKFKQGVLYAAVVAAFQVPIAAEAAGLGRLTVQSALGQPLRAEIEIVNASRDEINQLQARLAPFATIRNGLADPVPLPRDLRFSIEPRAGGRYVVSIRTFSSINDPYLVLPIEIAGSDAGLVREFTLLFDPIDDRRAVEPPVVASVPSAAAGAGRAPTPRVYEPTDREIVLSTPASSRAAPAPQRDAAPAAPVARRPAAAVDGATYRVAPGDTLGRIAAATRGPNMSVTAAADAIFNANPDAFVGGNPDRLMAGVDLVLPEGFEPRAVATERSAQPSARAAGGPQPRVQSAGRGDTLSLSPDRARGVDRLVIAEDRVAELEKSLEALEALVARQAQKLASMEGSPNGVARNLAPPSAANPNAEASGAGAAAGAAAPTATPATPAAAPAVTPQPQSATVTPKAPVQSPVGTEVEASWWQWLDGIRDMLIGALVAAFAVIGIGRLRARRAEKNAAATAAAVPEAIDPFASDDASIEPIKPVAVPAAAQGPVSIELPMATVQSTGGDSTFDGSAIDAGEQVDPIAEAEVYLAYGRSAQAEEVLKDALERDPANEAVALRLLEIYADRGDVEGFHTTAQIVKILTRETGEGWAKVGELRGRLEAAVRTLVSPDSKDGLSLVDDDRPANDDRAARESKFG